MKMKKWKIVLNEHQLKLIAGCLEDCCRFMSGQMELENTTRLLENPRSLWNSLNELQPLVTPSLEKGMNYDWAGTHCPNREQKVFIAETYYLYRKIIEEAIRDMTRSENYPLGDSGISETLRCKDSGESIIVERIE